MVAAPVWGSQMRSEGETRVVVLTGELDMDASSELQDVLLDEVRRPDTAAVVADMSAVTFLDSTALSSLLIAHTAAHDLGKPFTVNKTSRSVRRVLEVTGLYDLLTTA